MRYYGKGIGTGRRTVTATLIVRAGGRRQMGLGRWTAISFGPALRAGRPFWLSSAWPNFASAKLAEFNVTQRYPNECHVFTFHIVILDIERDFNAPK